MRDGNGIVYLQDLDKDGQAQKSPKCKKDISSPSFHLRTESPRVNGKFFADNFAGMEQVEAPGQAEHRPCGLAQGPDGALYVSDDVRGTIYKITYQGANR